MCVWGLLGVGGQGTGDSYGGRRDVLSTVLRRAGVPLSQGDRGGGGGGAGDRCSLARCFSVKFLWNAKGVFCFILFFVKLKQTKKNLHLLLEPPYLKKKEKKNKKNLS